MLNAIVNDEKFANIMQKNIQDVIVHLFSIEQHFGILCKIEEVYFEPKLPDEINNEFHQITLFFLAAYTFDTARIVGQNLVFEAGFGAENIGSIVTVPLISILQVIVEETPILINLSNFKKELNIGKKVGEDGVENSTASFLSNPENSKFF